MHPLKIAVEENWRCNLTGVLVKALKQGVPTEDAKAPCTFFGWKEWADEAIRRQLMEYSSSHQGDILVHLVGGVSSLWSQLRGLSWAEVELLKFKPTVGTEAVTADNTCKGNSQYLLAS